MDSQNNQAKEFFNDIADTYKDKYKNYNKFHHYFFNERLRKASEGFDFRNATILDIGTGTGDLYDHLKSIDLSINFYGSDIAEKMIAESNIPKENQFVGKITEIDLPRSDFDYIYMLGVTTYLPEDEMVETLKTIEANLAQNGKAILTFTNSNSFDNFNRTLLKLPVKLMKSKRSVLGQGFKIYKYSVSSAKELVNPWFNVQEVRYLNHTVFPWNLILKSASVSLANQIDKMDEGPLLRSLSSDFMLVLSKK